TFFGLRAAPARRPAPPGVRIAGAAREVPLVAAAASAPARFEFERPAGPRLGRATVLDLPAAEADGADIVSRIVIVEDLTGLEAARLRAEAEAEAAAVRMRAAERRAAEGRLMLESCSLLLGGSTPGSPGESDPVEVTDLVAEWRAEAEAGHLVGALAADGAIPPLTGRPAALRAAVRQALTLAYARSGHAPADLTVIGRGLTADTVGL